MNNMKETRFSAANRIVTYAENDGQITVEVRRFTNHDLMESETFTNIEDAEKRFGLLSELWRYRDAIKSYDKEHGILTRHADARGLSAHRAFIELPRLREICERSQELVRRINDILEQLGRGCEAIIDGWTDDLTLDERNAMLFARKHSGQWHTYADDASDAICSLERKGIVETNEFQQFRAVPVIK